VKRLNGVLIEVLAPLALFYGLRAAGVDQLLALLAGAAIPVVTGLRDLAAGQRIGGVRWFVLGAMAVTVAGSFISGSPRALLLRGVVLMAALGGFLLVTVWAGARSCTRRRGPSSTRTNSAPGAATGTTTRRFAACCACAAPSGRRRACSTRRCGR
jgi:hypothetical protein